MGLKETARAFSDKYIGLVIFLLFLANVMNYGHRLLLSILLPDIKAEIGLSDTQSGMLLGGAFALFYALAGLPLARLADRHVRRTFIAVALLFWSILTALMGAVVNFWQMLMVRIGIGVGEAICIPCSHSLITDYVSSKNRATAFAFHSTGATVGITLSLVLGGYLAAACGWRATLMIMAAPGIVLALIIWRVMKEPPRGYADGGLTKDIEQPLLRDVVKYLVSRRTYLFVVLAVCFGMLVEFGTNQWLPSFYVRQFGMTLDDVGLQYGLAVAIGGIPGSALGGILADRLIRRDLRWMLWFPALFYTLAIPVGLFMLMADNAQTALILNGFYAFLILATNGPFWASVFVLVPPMMRATASAVTLMAGGIVGLAAGPLMVGIISDYLTASLGDEALRASLIVIELLAVTVIFSMLMASRYLKTELKTSYSSYRDEAQPAE